MLGCGGLSHSLQAQQELFTASLVVVARGVHTAVGDDCPLIHIATLSHLRSIQHEHRAVGEVGLFQ
jgi:hypothetical protein